MRHLRGRKARGSIRPRRVFGTNATVWPAVDKVSICKLDDMITTTNNMVERGNRDTYSYASSPLILLTSRDVVVEIHRA